MIILTSSKMPLAVSSYFENVLSLPENPDLDSRIAFHTDLSVFSFGHTLVCAPYIFSFLKERIPQFELIKGEEPKSPYPTEVLYNAALVGRKLFCNIKYTSQTILSECEKREIIPVNVPQGYAKCSTVIVDDMSIITSDRSIQKAAEKEGIAALWVSNEGVFLDGYPNGFIGGASTVTENEVIFTGDIFRSPDAEKTIDFIEKRGKKPVFFSDMPLYDLGSPIVLA